MRALLNTLGASVWGLTAIILAGAVATVGYRLTLNHPADDAGDSGAPAVVPSWANKGWPTFELAYVTAHTLGVFLPVSKSLAVEQDSRVGDRLVANYGIDHEPTIVVNGKYRLNVASAGNPDRLIELVNYLVGKEAVAAGPS
jgi:hypothetical protein